MKKISKLMSCTYKSNVRATVDVASGSINGTISAVRYTIVQNPTEYPKIRRVFERI